MYTHKRQRWPLLLAILLLAVLTIPWSSGGNASAAPASAPTANSTRIIGFNAHQFGGKVYAYWTGTPELQELTSSQNGTWQTADVTQLAGSPAPDSRLALTGFSSAQFGGREYGYIDVSKHVQELTLQNGTWQKADLMALTGAPLPDPASELVGFDAVQFASRQYGYIDVNGHVQQLIGRKSGAWQKADLTALTGAPAASGGSMVGFASAQFHSIQYSYIDVNGHVIELYQQGGLGGAWQTADLTAITGAPVSGPGGYLTGFDSQQFASKQYGYIDVNKHVQELYVQNGAWQKADLTAITGAPVVSIGSSLTGFDSDQYQSKQYGYLDEAGHMQELYVQNGAWQKADLTAITGAPLPGLDPGSKNRHVSHIEVVGFDASDFGLQSKQYAFVNINNGDVQELSFVTGKGWQTADISLLV